MSYRPWRGTQKKRVKKKCRERELLEEGKAESSVFGLGKQEDRNRNGESGRSEVCSVWGGNKGWGGYDNATREAR